MSAISILIAFATTTQETPAIMAERMLASAEALVSREEPTQKVYLLTRLADVWRPRDKARSRRLLSEAWDECDKLGANAARLQRDVAHSWARLDFAEGAKRAESIKGANDSASILASALASAEPERAGRMISSWPSSMNQTAYDLMREGPEKVIRLVDQFDAHNRDETLAAVATSYIAENRTGSLKIIQAIKDPTIREEAIGDSIAELAPYEPAEATKMLSSLRSPVPRIAGLAACASALRLIDPPKARALGEEAVKLIESLGPEADMDRIRFLQFVPLARAKAPGIERLLRAWDAKSKPRGNDSLRIGAWAYVDLKHAESLFNPDQDQGFLESSCFGLFVADWYVDYLSALAVKEPERAAKYTRALVPNPKAFESGTIMVGLYQVLEKIRDEPEKMVRRFVEAYGDENFELTFNQYSLGQRALADPAKAIPILMQMGEEDGYIWGWSRSQTALGVARRLLPDISAGERALGVIEDADSLAQNLSVLARKAYPVNPNGAMPLFAKAARMTETTAMRDRSDVQVTIAENLIRCAGAGWASAK